MADETTTTGAGEAAAENLESGKSHVKKAADDFRAAAGAKVNELRSAAEGKVKELRSTAESKVNELRGHAEHAYGDARSRAQTLHSDGEKYVRENPTRAVLTALGIGFVLGLMFRR